MTIYLTCLKIGAVSIPLLPVRRETELIWALNKYKARIFFTSTLFKQTRPVDLILLLQNQLPRLQQIVTIDRLVPAMTLLALSQLFLAPPLTQMINVYADKLAAALSTSGTEGTPKDVMPTHSNISTSERAHCTRLSLTWQDVFLVPAPLEYATDLLRGVTTPFLVGMHSVLLDIFTPIACLELLEQQRCTCVFSAIPPVYDMLCNMEKRSRDLSSLRFFLCGGITIPQEIARDCQQLGIKLLSIHGSAESSPHILVNLDDSPSCMVNIGEYATVSVEIKVIDEAHSALLVGVESEEASRSSNVFMGYLDEPGFTTRVPDQDNWYYNGDLCRMDSAGYIKITERKKDTIARGGENINSCEVEDILLQHPHTCDVCIVAMSDERLGERSYAYVVLKPPCHSLSSESVAVFFSRRWVAKYRYPEHIVIVEKLPRAAPGEVQEYQLYQDIVQCLSVENITGQNAGWRCSRILFDLC